METSANASVSIETKIQAKIEKTWDYWTNPNHIVNWNFASDTWHAPSAENDLRRAGKFRFGMAAKDGSASFDFEGIYDEIKPMELIRYTLLDGRRVEVRFIEDENSCNIIETFETEHLNPVEVQQEGWQAILENFRKYVEST